MDTSKLQIIAARILGLAANRTFKRSEVLEMLEL
jgi:hypothetical protein